MKVLVRGKKPFKITSVESPSGAFEFKTDEDSERPARRGSDVCR